MGGPIVKDKTFFFGSYEGTRVITGETEVAGFESRDWSSYVAGYGRPVAAFLYATYPAPELDSVISTVGDYLTDWDIANDQASVDVFLGKTFGSPPGTLSKDAPMIGEASFFTPGSSDSDGFSLRIDQELGQSDKLYGRYFFDSNSSVELFPRPRLHRDWRGENHLLALNWTHIFAPNMINGARFGFTRFIEDEIPSVQGILYVWETSIDSGFEVDGGPVIWRQNIFTWADTLSINLSSHGLKMGAEVRRNQEDSDWDVGGAGYYFYDLIYLALDDPYYQAGGINPQLDKGPGHAELASNLRDWRGTEIGLFFNDDWKLLPNLTLNLGVRWDWYGRLTEAHNRATAFEMPVGDNIFERVYYGSFTGPVDRLSEDDWNNIAPRFGFAWDPFSNGKMSLRGGYGIAFQSSIFNPLSNSRWNKPFYSINSVCTDPQLCGEANSILYGPQNGEPVRMDGPNPNPGASNSEGNIMAYDPNNPNNAILNGIPNPSMRDPYVQSLFLGIQRELVRNTTLEVNYVGTLGRKLIRAENFNRYPGDLLGEPNPVSGENQGDTSLNRINSREGVLRFWENSVSSNYHALQVQLNRRYAQGLTINANYTLAKSLDTRSSSLSDFRRKSFVFNNWTFSGKKLSVYISITYTNQTTQVRQTASWHSGGTTSNRMQEGYSTDVYNQKLDYGRSIFDARQRVTISWLCDMPVFQSSDSWFLKNILGGWQVNGIVALQSGQPFTPYCGPWNGACDWNADGELNDRPNTPAIGNSISSERSDFVNPNGGIFDIPSSSPGRAPTLDDKLEYFGEPEAGTNGDLGRNTYEGPGFANVDLSFFKEVGLSVLSEEARLQLRVEFFNLFNRVNFYQPENRINSYYFGRARRTFDAREIQLGLKFIF